MSDVTPVAVPTVEGWTLDAEASQPGLRVEVLNTTRRETNVEVVTGGASSPAES